MKKKFYTIREAEKIASAKTRKGTFIWAQSGSEDDYTTNKNIADLNSIKIYPRVLKKIIKADTTVSFLNNKFESPLVLSPMGHQTQFHKRGEIETTIGLKNINIPITFTTQGRTTLNEIRNYSVPKKLIWQFFLFGDKSWILKQIRLAEENECLAISICLDAPIRSFRYSDRETKYDARKYGSRSLELSPDVSMALKYNFSIIEWIRSKTKLPIIPKGIMHLNDTKRLVNLGADAIWLSNHGGRMFNSGISVCDILTDHKKYLKKNKIPIIADGGIRRGSDIIKYLSLGADIVGVGRPALYGLMANGKKGVENIFKILQEELFISMTNSGIKDIKSIKRQ